MVGPGGDAAAAGTQVVGEVTAISPAEREFRVSPPPKEGDLPSPAVLVLLDAAGIFPDYWNQRSFGWCG